MLNGKTLKMPGAKILIRLIMKDQTARCIEEKTLKLLIKNVHSLNNSNFHFFAYQIIISNILITLFIFNFINNFNFF